MIDSKVFAELQNRNVITHVGLKSTDFKDLSELENYGFATQQSADIEYDVILNEIVQSENLIDAFFKAVSAGGDAVVPCDIVLDTPLMITKDVVIDLNGFTIKSAQDVFDVAGKLTINGDGKVIAATDNTCSWCAVFAHDAADVTINGGEYSVGAPEGDYNDLIYAKDTAKITINNGRFRSNGTVRNDGTSFILNLKDKSDAVITVKGGAFENFNPAEANTEPGGLYNFVAEGYKSEADLDYFVVNAVA